MLTDLAEIAVGALGTVVYLLTWSGVRRRLEAGAASERSARSRRRTAQTLFFVLLTPWVLLLFWLMERIGPWLGDG